MAILLPDAREATPPPATSTRTQGAVGDVGASTSSPVIDMDPINVIPSGTNEDLVKDQVQLEQAPKNPGSSGTPIPNSSSSSPTLPRREIDWNDTPW
jgi:hypothetical protein